ncbi:MAG TPA: hypothetical protein VE783_08215 [Candidatus Limnocylindrales bacterium]|jgi:hypothetical protein|nr:hypothetical protein [Candidatus Limnocylindrales bacterium]
MSASAGPVQGRRFRWAGYFVLVIAALSSLDWLATIRRDYVMEHHWPAATGTVYSMTEQSREVDPPSLRQRQRTTYYWAQFDVLLQLSPEQCPGGLLARNAQQPECQIIVRSPASTSPAAVVRWFRRHPVNSTVAIHYNPASGRTWMGGESPLDIYPMGKIAVTCVMLTLAAILLLIARRLSFADATDASATDEDSSLVSIRL